MCMLWTQFPIIWIVSSHPGCAAMVFRNTFCYVPLVSFIHRWPLFCAIGMIGFSKIPFYCLAWKKAAFMNLGQKSIFAVLWSSPFETVPLKRSRATPMERPDWVNRYPAKMWRKLHRRPFAISVSRILLKCADRQSLAQDRICIRNSQMSTLSHGLRWSALPQRTARPLIIRKYPFPNLIFWKA